MQLCSAFVPVLNVRHRRRSEVTVHVTNDTANGVLCYGSETIFNPLGIFLAHASSSQ